VAAALALAALAAAASAGGALAAGPDVRFLTVTDVTPRSFRVVWLSSDPADATLRLFEAPACTNEIFTADVVPFPLVSGVARLADEARQRGVMVAQVSGLTPDTDYCVQTVTTSLFDAQQTLAPDPPLIVRTERRTTRARAASPSDPNEVGFSNDLARLQITRSVPGADTRGAVVLLKVRGAASPLTAFVGDGIDDDADITTYTDLALVDLNNLYGATTHESMDLSGDGTEEISARVLGSPEGYVTVHARIVPPDAGLAEAKAPAACLGAGATACDGRLGDADGDGIVALADADAVQDLVVGLTPILGCMVCGDPTWDFEEDMIDALAVAQAVAGLRLLPW
jgi:hypothetical protein